MAEFYRDYGLAAKVRIPVVKASSSDLAVTADWTPATGDTKLSKDGGAIANLGSNPAVITSSAMWEFTFTATEMQCLEATVTVIDSATKAVQDQAFSIRTRPEHCGLQGTATSGSTTTVADTGLSLTTDQYAGWILEKYESTGASRESRNVTTNTATTFTLASAFATAAASGTRYRLFPDGRLAAVVDASGRVDVGKWLGTACATPTVAGVPEVDLTHVTGATTNVSALATNVDAILTDTGTTLDGRIPAALVGGRMDSNMGAISTDATAADNAESFFDGTGYKDVDNLYVIRSATAQAGAGTTVTLDASASATDDFYNNNYIHIIGGTGANQARFISDYVGATKVATVNATWVTNPSSDSVFIIYPFSTIPGASAPTAAEVADAVWDEDATAHQTQGTFGQAIGDPVADANTIFKAVVTDATGATVGIDTAALITAVDTIDNFLDTEIAAILAAVDTEIATIISVLGTPAGASLAADIAAIEAQTDDIGAAGAGLTALATAANLTTVDTVVDSILAMLDDARTEPAQGAPPVNPDAMTKIDYLYKAWRNKKTQTATLLTIFADNGSTADHKSTVSDDGTTFTAEEVITGA